MEPLLFSTPLTNWGFLSFTLLAMSQTLTFRPPVPSEGNNCHSEEEEEEEDTLFVNGMVTIGAV